MRKIINTYNIIIKIYNINSDNTIQLLKTFTPNSGIEADRKEINIGLSGNHFELIISAPGISNSLTDYFSRIATLAITDAEKASKNLEAAIISDKEEKQAIYDLAKAKADTANEKLKTVNSVTGELYTHKIPRFEGDKFILKPIRNIGRIEEINKEISELEKHYQELEIQKKTGLDDIEAELRERFNADKAELLESEEYKKQSKEEQAKKIQKLEDDIYKPKYDMRNDFNDKMYIIQKKYNYVCYEKNFVNKTDNFKTIKNSGGLVQQSPLPSVSDNCMWLSICAFLRTKYSNINIDDIKYVGGLIDDKYNYTEFNEIEDNFRRAIGSITDYFNLDIRIFHVKNDMNKIISINNDYISNYQIDSCLPEPHSRYTKGYKYELNDMDNPLTDVDTSIVNIASYGYHFELITEGYELKKIEGAAIVSYKNHVGNGGPP